MVWKRLIDFQIAVMSDDNDWQVMSDNFWCLICSIWSIWFEILCIWRMRLYIVVWNRIYIGYMWYLLVKIGFLRGYQDFSSRLVSFECRYLSLDFLGVETTNLLAKGLLSIWYIFDDKWASLQCQKATNQLNCAQGDYIGVWYGDLEGIYTLQATPRGRLQATAPIDAVACPPHNYPRPHWGQKRAALAL